MINVHQYWVYILSNNSRTSYYVGVTNDLYRRYIEHRNGMLEGFTKNIGVIPCFIMNVIRM